MHHILSKRTNGRSILVIQQALIVVAKPGSSKDAYAVITIRRVI